MNAQQLKNAILQEAIQGRLVPQDPNDEPASVLLDRIRKEKLQLVKEGKLKKKDLEEKPISEDEKPFEIPESWEWVRLAKLCVRFSTGPFGTMLHKEDYVDKNGHPLINPTNIKDGSICYDGIKMVSNNKYTELNAYVLQFNDLVIARRGDLSKIAIVSEKENGWLAGTGAFFMHFVDGVFLPYFLLLYSSSYCQAYLLAQSVGGTMNNLNQSLLANMLVPLPPLAEQKRIVAKIEELMPKVEEYGKAQEKLNKLNEKLPEKLKKSILQEAIEGRLVPQDPNDEPASALLQRIRAEKERLVKEGKLKKKDLIETPIAEDEIPFEIPESWRWERLGELVSNQTGLSYSKGDLEKRVNSPIRVLRGGNIQNGSWCTKVDDVMIAPEYIKKPNLTLQKNTFITPAVTSLEHLGKTALIEEDHSDIVAGGFVLYLLPFYRNDIFSKYLLYYFQSAYYNTYCQSIANKSGQAFWNLSRQKLMNLVLPIPPLAEQHRIVEKLEQMLSEIDKLKK